MRDFLKPNSKQQKITFSQRNRCQLHISCSIPVTYCNKYHNCASLFSDRLTISEFTVLRKLADQKSKSHTHMALTDDDLVCEKRESKETSASIKIT